MRLEHVTEQVTALFDELDGRISRFQSATTLHCGFGCGKCCFKPDIEATVLEFLPFAMQMYKNGVAHAWYERLQNSTDVLCLLLNPASQSTGLCTEYKHRGLICRLFGYSARTNKHGEKELVTCAIIKTEQSGAFAEAERKLAAGLDVPVMSAYYMQLTAIDPDLSRDFYPINVAIRKAIETVLHYYAYRSESESRDAIS
jgi:Fe-S-cluster containining protein